MLARRIIPCLDVRGGRVVKGVRFRDHIDVGDPVEMAHAYSAEGADELVFYDITASPEGRGPELGWIEAVARVIDIPFCVAGGIRTLDHALACLTAGADKVSINSPALERPDLTEEIAQVAGSQCVVVGVDSEQVEGQWRVRQYTGDPSRQKDAGRLTLDWIAEAQSRGAGEIVLNCMDRDGVRQGYDIEQLQAARSRLSIPLIASGGAGSAEHFRDVFDQADVSGALAASVFHSRKLTVPDLKQRLARWHIPVRL
ncbi:imidazole glycerol phosphate synthase subunit HisF [Brevundimonas sp. 2R-24]|uniref:Imidazole glycerol phosphate synthase subunit HisF n=1 Tax=Peiella sedimenti TaxID=3061083 RepID=A0ABT8SKR6_9CAUL|nr:imidazole glycerol phosphate synthase subunit HisF [Caulobacteraceae bacterium XZ-24]